MINQCIHLYMHAQIILKGWHYAILHSIMLTHFLYKFIPLCSILCFAMLTYMTKTWASIANWLQITVFVWLNWRTDIHASLHHWTWWLSGTKEGDDYNYTAEPDTMLKGLVYETNCCCRTGYGYAPTIRQLCHHCFNLWQQKIVHVLL